MLSYLKLCWRNEARKCASPKNSIWFFMALAKHKIVHVNESFVYQNIKILYARVMAVYVVALMPKYTYTNLIHRITFHLLIALTNMKWREFTRNTCIRCLICARQDSGCVRISYFRVLSLLTLHPWTSNSPNH